MPTKKRKGRNYSMKHLISKLKELEERELDVVVSRGVLSLHQTQRNQMKAEIIEALYEDIKEAVEPEGYGIFKTQSGPILDFLNRGVEKKIMGMLSKEELEMYTGLISIQFDAIMKNLDTNGAYEENYYLQDLELKRIKAEEKEKAKKLKIQQNAEWRAENARKREEEMAYILARKQEIASEKAKKVD